MDDFRIVLDLKLRAKNALFDVSASFKTDFTDGDHIWMREILGQRS